MVRVLRGTNTKVNAEQNEGNTILGSQTTDFNPSSRSHIANRLINKYGWKPKSLTPSGQPKIDEAVLSTLPYPEAQKMAEYFLIGKRLPCYVGSQSWLRHEKDGMIHHNIIVTL